MDAWGIADRIRAGIAAGNREQQAVAKAIGTDKQTLNRLVSNPPEKSKYYPALAKALGCSVEWLLTGNGEAPSWASGHPVQEDERRRYLTIIDTLTRRVDQLSSENDSLRRSGR